MLRVGIFLDTEVLGGAEEIVGQLALALPKLGIEPHIFCFQNPQFQKRCEALGLSFEQLPHRELYKHARTLPLFCWKFSKILRERKIQLLHSHLIGAVFAGSISTLLARLPHVGTLHDTYSLEEKPHYLRALQLSALAGTRLVAVSKSIEEFFLAHCWLPAGRVQTIVNGITPPTQTVNRQEIRRSLDVSDTEVLIFSAGRLVELKQFDLLIRAFARIPQNLPVKLCIAGSGPCREQLNNLVRELDEGSRVQLLGFRTDISDLLQAADCFSLVSRTEGLSCSILEAMSFGLPIIATKVGGNCELVADGQSGYLVNADVSDIHQKLELISGSSELRARMAIHSKSLQEDRFSLDSMAASYASLFTSRIA